MPLSITNQSKNTITITNQDKPSNQTWEDMGVPLDDVDTTWAEAGTSIVKENKNNITITNENKS